MFSLTDKWLLVWRPCGLLASTPLSGVIFSKYDNTFLTQGSHNCKHVPFVLQYTAAVKNTWATAILFPIESQWLLKWRWLRDIWCRLCYCMYQVNDVPWQQCMQSADHINHGKEAVKNHFMLQLWLWLWQQPWIEIVAAHSGKPWR